MKLLTRGPWATSPNWDTVPINKNIFCKAIIIPLRWLKERIHYLLFVNWLFLLCKNFNPLHPRVWLKLARLFWRKRCLNFVNVFALFHYYLPLELGVALHLNKIESPLPKDAFWQAWFNWPIWFWRKIFKFRQCIFAIL